MRSSHLQTCLFLLAGRLTASECSGAEEKAAFPRVWVSTTEVEAVQPKNVQVHVGQGQRQAAVLEKGRLRMRRVPKKPKKIPEQKPIAPVRTPPGSKIRLQQQPDMAAEPVYDLSEPIIQDDYIEEYVEPNPRVARRQQTDMLFVPFPYYSPPGQGDYGDVSLDELDDDWLVMKKPETAQAKPPIVIARCPQMMM